MMISLGIFEQHMFTSLFAFLQEHVYISNYEHYSDWIEPNQKPKQYRFDKRSR